MSQRRSPGLRAAALVGALLTSLAVVGCEEEHTAVLLEVMSQAEISEVRVNVKQYFDDGHVELLGSDTADVLDDKYEYVIGRGGRPLKMRVELPGPGRYALHLVATPLVASGDPLTATLCYAVDGVVVDRDVALGIMTTTREVGGEIVPGLDDDGDTFPEDLEAYCNARQSAGLVCEMACHSAAFSALVDCNPAADLEPSPGCGAVPERPSWNPFVEDHCADCYDQDCYGGDARCEDRDGDGYPGDVDCNDGDAAIYPGAAEIPCNGIDENCLNDHGCETGDALQDADGDGYEGCEPCGECPGCEPCPDCVRDCDDSDPAINPRAFEGCGSDPSAPDACPGCDDTIDNNCDGGVNDGCFPDDIDDDGVPATEDCNDCDSGIGPTSHGYVESCGDGVDEDCSFGGLPDGDLPCSLADHDGDGFEAAPAGADCDDEDPHRYPGAPDRCGDGVDQDCASDRACSDDDGDGFSGLEGPDCRDDLPGVNPWATEECDGDGLDEDCDGYVNEVLDPAGLRGCGFDPGTDGSDPGSWYEIFFETDLDHCGRCRHRCRALPCYSEGDGCVGGECTCDGGPGCGGTPESFCCTAAEASSGAAGCYDVGRDTGNCGECGWVCRPGETCEPRGPCSLGECSCNGGPACDHGECWACCSGSGCTDLCHDETACGTCETDCTGGLAPRGDICDGSSPGVATCYCGAVGVRCTGTEWCTEVTEPPGATCGCADLNTETDNCGACGFECDPGERCVGGSCECQPTGVDCDGTESDYCCPGAGCVDRLTNVHHCGGCGVACAFGETCVGGVCRCGSSSGCNPALEDCCSGRCYEVMTDPSHCGLLGTGDGCTRSCRPGVRCAGGSCACGGGGDCGAGETCCSNSYCANLSTDESNCGDCGTVCRPGEECQSGSCRCTPTCSDGNSCTEDPCVGDRCEHHTLDGDDDGYCAAACPDAATGTVGECTDGDCDDSRSAVHPGATESCSTAYDDDCDGSTNDEGATGCTIFYFDQDNDTYGTSTSRCLCRAEGSYRATVSGDCNDSSASVHPGATELCNRVDDDCSSSTSDGSGESWFGTACDGSDADLCQEGTWVCSAAGAQTCNDPNDVDVEVCDGADNDCRPSTADGSGESWYGAACDGSDADLCTEGSFTCTSGAQVCTDPNDADPDVCDGVNNDCNAATADGSADCPGLCCGTPRACHACCDDGDCPGAERCNASYACYCPGISCSGTCYDPGECCGDGDCSGDETCNTTTHLCECGGVSCSGTCYDPGECCDDGDCPGEESCDTGTHTCFCDGIVCGGTCYDPGVCCAASDCGTGTGCSCSSHACSPSTCTGGDNCCPTGCTHSTDSDCP